MGDDEMKLPEGAEEFVSDGMPALRFRTDYDTYPVPCVVRVPKADVYELDAYDVGDWESCKESYLVTAEVCSLALLWIRAQWAKMRDKEHMHRMSSSPEDYVTRERHDRVRRRLMRKWLVFKSAEYAQMANDAWCVGDEVEWGRLDNWSTWCEGVATKLEEMIEEARK
jgi:hypothetical protein